MGLKQPMMRVDSAAPGHSQQFALHPLCLPGVVGCLNSTLGSVVANYITIPKRKTILLSLYMVKSGGFKIMTPLCGHAAHNSGFRMPGDLVGASALTRDHYAFTVQALSRSTICRFPLTRLQEAQLRQSALAQGLLQAIAHQTGQAQRQITRTDLPALARLGMLIKDMSIHHKKQNLSGTEFELPMPRTDISDFIALAPRTISHLIGSFTEKKILIFGNETFRLLDHHALEHACEALN